MARGCRCELRLSSGTKGKEKVSLKLSSPEAETEGARDEIKLSFSWALEPAAVLEGGGGSGGGGGGGGGGELLLPEELVACEVARRVPAPSPWSELDGLMAQMDNQVLRLVDPYQVSRGGR